MQIQAVNAADLEHTWWRIMSAMLGVIGTSWQRFRDGTLMKDAGLTTGPNISNGRAAAEPEASPELRTSHLPRITTVGATGTALTCRFEAKLHCWAVGSRQSR